MCWKSSGFRQAKATRSGKRLPRAAGSETGAPLFLGNRPHGIVVSDTVSALSFIALCSA